MLGLRTPAKKYTPWTSASQGTPPDAMSAPSPVECLTTQTNVRRSIGEWGASKAPSLGLVPAAPTKAKKPKHETTTSIPTAHVDSVELADSPTTASAPRTSGRLQEAKTG